MKSGWKKAMITGMGIVGAYAAVQAAVNSWGQGGKPSNGGRCGRGMPAYEDKIKPVLDKAFSFVCLVAASPLFVLISAAVFLDDPGPVFFTQKRVGKDRRYMRIHKFRSMVASAPHDVPTHQLAGPEQYITRVGRILRKTSLDELPQLWDVFRGRMSIVGPRPALWNQDDLLRERDKYGANSAMPGLTGLAQVKGRDRLEVAAKAALDGQYVEILRKGGAAAFWQDVKCLFNTAGAVLRRDGVIEGGAGAAKKAVP